MGKHDKYVAVYKPFCSSLMALVPGPFSCDVCDSQKDVFEGKPPKNLDFKKQKWKVTLNILNTILKKKKQSSE